MWTSILASSSYSSSPSMASGLHGRLFLPLWPQLLLLPLLLLSAGLPQAAAGCPLLCQCTQPYFVYCTGQQVRDVDLPLLLADVPPEAILLDLSDNEIRTLPPTLLNRLPQLQLLHLKRNRIAQIGPGVFSNHSRLELVDLSRNSVNEVLNGTFANLSSLRTIHLNDNYVERIEAGAFSGLGALRTLNFSSNQLSSLRRAMFYGVPATLEEVDFSSNAIQRVEAGCFRGLPRLRRLLLGHNLLENVSSSTFEGAGQLQELRLDNNQLSSLASLTWPPFQGSIQTLILSNNRLALVHNNVFNDMPLLRTLDLSHNRIASVQPGAVWRLRLDTLSLAHNALTAVDRRTLDRLERVRTLDLGFNAIASLGTGSFDAFRDSVQRLDLRDNALTWVHPGMFRGMVFLQKLNLANNSVRKVDDSSFADLARLQVLDLSHNRLERVTTGMLEGLSLWSLHLECNPLQEFRGFRFDEVSRSVRIHMNLTVTSVQATSVDVRWPYVEGSQLYWSLSVECLHKNVCAPSEAEGASRETYLKTNVQSTTVGGLTPRTEYYVCVRPVFVDEAVRLEQCAHVTTLEKVVIETASPTVQSANLTSGGSSDFLHWRRLVVRVAVTVTLSAAVFLSQVHLR